MVEVIAEKHSLTETPSNNEDNDSGTATKVYFNEGKLQPEAIAREIEGSLKRLGMDYVDLYQLHRCKIIIICFIMKMNAEVEDLALQEVDPLLYATGTTKSVAEDLAKVMDATLFEIEPTEKYTSADLDWREDSSRSSVEMHDPNSRPAVKDKVDNMAQYDVVFIGYLIWWYIVPTISNTLIDENNFDGKKVYSFATSGGYPIGPCVDALKKQYLDIDWQEGKLLNHASKETLEAWKQELGL